MGSSIKQGQSIFIPFVNGESVPDSQNRPRMYKTVEQFEKNARLYHGEIPILIEYVPAEKKSRENPLTLEELRKMDGRPVWVQNLEHPDKSQWRLCHWDRGKYLVLQGISIQGYLLEDYGETWLAYAAEPPRFDRSAWEPCAWCAGKACANCSRAETPSCEICQTCREHNHWEPDSKFCPDCGRPRTDSAWEMLEKRLEGAK